MTTGDEKNGATKDPKVELTNLQKELIKETSFWDLLGLVFKIKSNPENLIIPLVCFVVFLFCNSFEMSGGTSISVSSVAGSAKDLTGWYYTILGFLITGYTVFATVTSVKNSVRMAKNRESDSGLLFLKFFHATFFKTLIVFFMASCFSLFTVFFLRDYGFFGILMKEFGGSMHYLLSLIDALNISLFVLSIMMMKSFLFNIYYSVMMAAALGVQDEFDQD